MRNFYINPFSISPRFKSRELLYQAFEGVIDALKYVWPMIKSGRSVLFLDSSMDTKSFIKNEDFRATLNNLREYNGDLPRLWYLYTKNRGIKLPDLPRLADISCTHENINFSERGELDLESTRENPIWISFKGNPLFEAPSLSVNFTGCATLTISNSFHQLSLQPLLPFFLHSDKHTSLPYYDKVRGENVAAMPIRSQREAGDTLRNGFKFGDDIFSYHPSSSSVYRFKPTINNVYHGFIINISEIPAPLRDVLLD